MVKFPHSTRSDKIFIIARLQKGKYVHCNAISSQALSINANRNIKKFNR